MFGIYLAFVILLVFLLFVWATYVGLTIGIFINQTRFIEKMEENTASFEKIGPLLEQGWLPKKTDSVWDDLVLVPPPSIREPDFIVDNPFGKKQYIETAMEYIESYCFYQKHTWLVFKTLFVIDSEKMEERRKELADLWRKSFDYCQVLENKETV